jgi:4-hydroxybutyrate CoA-transferase
VKLAGIDEAIGRIPDGARIVASPCCGTPTTLVAAVADRSGGHRWSMWTGLLFTHEPVAAAVRRGELGYLTWHITAALEPLLAEGAIAYVPLRASRVPHHLAAARPEVALVRVTPPDRNGWCNVGPSLSYVRAALDHAALRIAEVDPDLPRVAGHGMVHVSELDALVEATEPLPLYAAVAPNEVSRAIAAHLVGLLPERPLLQLGIGAVPEALVTALAEQGADGLRFMGMGSDGMVDLDERGLLDRRVRDGFPPIVAPDLLGTGRLMTWAHENPSVALYPSSYVQNPRELARHERFVSVNSAIEVDLLGQVNAERMRGRQIAGIGGSIDFTEAATSSAGGVRVIALPSTTADGKVSRIVASIAPPSVVSIPGSLVEYVVTEHGVARLEGRSTRERAEALIAIAAPDHRDALAATLG